MRCCESEEYKGMTLPETRKLERPPFEPDTVALNKD